MVELTALHMVFDVESVGLHGEGFSVAWVVVDGLGAELSQGYVACPIDKAKGPDSDRAWVLKNVVPYLPEPTHSDPSEVREAFWKEWMHWRSKGVELFAECGWPVEARFLCACVDQNLEGRRWEGPFPLHEIASFEVAARVDKNLMDRTPEELPRHNPLADARMSARMLVESLRRLRR